MNRFARIAVFSTFSAALLAGPVFAQGDHHDDHPTYVKHTEWKKGYHMKTEDWGRGARVDDWKTHHLRQPPSGYEWRLIDGNYVLGSIDTGIISATIVAR